MKDILDQPEVFPESNYRRWYFRFFLYASIMTIAQFAIAYFFDPGSHNIERFARNYKLYTIMLWSCLIASAYFLSKSHGNHEEKGPLFTVTLIGILLLTAINLLL